MDRLTVLDRAVLRAGACELMTMPHLPARAVVSEYAAIADVCGCDVGFINAVLDRVARKAREIEMTDQKNRQGDR
jgi:N utilization substance protein B